MFEEAPGIIAGAEERLDAAADVGVLAADAVEIAGPFVGVGFFERRQED
jgi:hypothetical protein